MSEYTEGQLTAGELATEKMTFIGPYVPIKAPAALMMFDGMFAVVGGINTKQAKANARELVRRWNCFEELLGIVEEFEAALKRRIPDAAVGKAYKEARLQEIKAAIAKAEKEG